VGDEIILGLVDCLPPAQRLEVLAEQIVIKRVGMIPVEFLSLLEGEPREIPVIGIHIDERDGGRRQ